MDRGGTIRDCYIYQCQTLGMGVTDGYGGGVCMENNGVMRHTSVTNNMARVGGGLMIVYTPELHPYMKIPGSWIKYAPLQLDSARSLTQCSTGELPIPY